MLEPLFEMQGLREKDPLENVLSIFDKPFDVDAVKLVEESWDED